MKFGILTPSYNRPDLLLRAVNSVQANDHQDWVMCVVNDGSEVDYSEAETQLSDSRIRYIKLDQNRGCNHARNLATKCLLEAGCEYITWLDDDDYMDPFALSRAQKVIEGHSEFGWFICNHEFSQEVPSQLNSWITEQYTLDYIDGYLYGDTKLGDKAHFIRADLLKGVRCWEIVKNGEEWTFFIQLANRSKILAFPSIGKRGKYLPDGLTTKGIYPKFTPLIYFMELAKPTLALLKRPSNRAARKDFLKQVRSIPLQLIKTLLFSLRLYDPGKGLRRSPAQATSGNDET
jgi:glycosyltransferase involved in cell wall biosynthesis